MRLRRILIMILCLILTLSMVGCSKGKETDSPANFIIGTSFTPGTYTAIAKGNNGDMTVEVVLSENSIVSVKVKEHSETEGIGDKAIERIPEDIVKGQTLNVDVVTGATMTSNAILLAVEDCIKQAGGDLLALKAREEREGEKKEIELITDVVIIGGGGTGLAAAGAANEKGVDVVVLEKLASVGGSTALSAGGMGAPGTRFQKEQGVESTIDTWMEYWIESQKTSNPEGKYPDYNRVRKFMEAAVDTTHWIVDSMNHKFDSLALPEEKNGSHRTDKGGAGLIKAMEETLRSRGIHIVTETRVTEILTDDKGDAIGVRAESKEGTLVVHAKKVIIASGGFARNEELLDRFVPELAGYSDISIASIGSTGDGILMAEAIGAALYEDPWVIGVGIGGRIPEIGGLGFDPTRMYVNQDGKRYMDESSHYSIVTNKSTEQEKLWIVVDSSESNTDITKIMEANLEGGEVVKGDTIEELAMAMEVSEDNLLKTISSYNEAANTGNDEFGKAANLIKPIIQGPFFAHKVYPKTMGTMGGIKVDEHYRVLREDGSIINNLYAGGEAANRHIYNQVYMSASAVQYALTSGRLAGKHAAESIK